MIEPFELLHTNIPTFSQRNKESKNDVPVYLVSLKKDKERRRNIIDNMVTPEVVESVDGGFLERRKMISQKILENEKLKLGEIGCFLSHYNILEQISRDTKNSISFVIEDDAHFDHTQIKHFLKTSLPTFDWDIIFLGHNHHVPVVKDTNMFTKVSRVHGTHGYIVNHDNIRNKIHNLLPIKKPIDITLPLVFNCYILQDPIVSISPTFGKKSNTQGINKFRTFRKKKLIFLFVLFVCFLTLFMFMLR
ncbi:putative procollagen galactosyltransferase 2 [Mimivirus AB-566-O17]|uniref:Putative procollagen galactosyltransferase 2 n=1 Tax=Mimivirus AB-566-O17 TaxID=1988039 RepID=A0A1X9VNV9_9VIRU|nr:putative procollagen galactosyltransferase 2 [Mimivirus AB-566-O17]